MNYKPTNEELDILDRYERERCAAHLTPTERSRLRYKRPAIPCTNSRRRMCRFLITDGELAALHRFRERR